MGTITVTKENFGEKISFIYEELLSRGVLNINLENEDRDPIWTDYEEKAYQKAKKEFNKGETVNLNNYLKKRWLIK